jgi:hypothetical protein
MRDVNLGLAVKYDDGRKPNIAINNNAVVEVHESEGLSHNLWYRVGTPNQATVHWGDSHQYDQGSSPAVALNNKNVAVEVHVSEWHQLWYHVGTVSGKSKSVSWGDSRKYDEGMSMSPRVAVNDDGVVVEVHQSQEEDTLWYHLGKVNGSKVDFGEKSRRYDGGVSPAVALNNHGVVVEVHQSANDATLWYHVGRVAGDEINWGPSRKYDDGTQPAVALTDDGFVVEVHSDGGKLWRRVGTVSDDTIDWKTSRSFDDGEAPSVAVATDGRLAIQAHGSEALGTSLWFSTSLVTDRARWMEQRLPQLKDKTLKQLVLPASHDSGMYLNGLAVLAKTQDLSIYGQLANGIRYFDLRLKWSDGAFYIVHGVIQGPLFQDVLNDIRTFLKDHNELTIFRFAHFDNFSDSVYKTLVDQITATIGPSLYRSLPTGKRLADVTLGSYLADEGVEGVALVLFDGDYLVNKPQRGFWVFRGGGSSRPAEGDLRVCGGYSDTTSYATMKEDQFSQFIKYNGFCVKKTAVPCDLFNFSWTLTPWTDVRRESREPNRTLGQAIIEIEIPNSHDQIVNLVSVDFVEYARVTDVCLYLNHAPFVKK